MKPFPGFRVTLLFVLFLMLTAPVRILAQSQHDVRQIRRCIHAFYAAYQHRNTEKCMALWSKQSPNYDRFRQNIRQHFSENSRFRIAPTAPIEMEFVDHMAAAWTAFKLHAIASRPGKLADGPVQLRRVILFTNENGMWRIWKYTPAEQVLADKLAALHSEGEVERVLRQHPSRITADVVSELNRRSEFQEQQGRLTSAASLNHLALDVANFLSDPVQQAWCYWYRGKIEDHRGLNDQALKQFQRALVAFRSAGFGKGESRSLSNIASIYVGMGLYTRALKYYEESLKIARRTRDKVSEVVPLDNMGLVYQRMGNYPLALHYHKASLLLEREIQDDEGVSTSLNNIGLIYCDTGDYPKALESYRVSLEISRRIGNHEIEAAALGNTGNVYMELGDYKKAVVAFQTTLKICQEIHDQPDYVAARLKLAQVQENAGQYAQALEDYQACVKAAQVLGDKRLEAVALNNVGDIYTSTARYSEAL